MKERTMDAHQANQPHASNWKEADSSETAEILLSRTRDFHDAFVRFAHLDSGTYVNDSLHSLEKNFPSLWMLVQTQWRDTPAFELFFEELRKVEFTPTREYRGSVKVGPNDCETRIGGWKINSASLHFRFGSHSDLGAQPRTFYDRKLPGSVELVTE